MATKQRLTGVALLLALGVTGCESISTNYGGTDGIDPPVSMMTTNPEDATELDESRSNISASAVDLAERIVNDPERSQPTLFKGNDRVVRTPAERPAVQLYGEDVTLNFEEAPLTEVVHAIMGDILELDYIVEHPIKGEVTLRTRSPIPRNELLPILESLLQSNSAIMVRDNKGRYFVSGSTEMSTLNPQVSSARDSGAGFSTIVVPLSYISAAEMAEILRPVAPESAFVRVDARRNLLMLAGTRLQLNGWLDMVSTFDIDVLEGMSVGVFPLEHSDVEEMQKALDEIIGRGGEGSEGAEMESLVRFVPVERLNSILVVTPRAHYLEKIGDWIKRLDREPDANFEQRLYVYPVQNSTAMRLAELLSKLFTGTGGGGGGGSAGGVAPGLTPERVSGGALGGSLGGSRGRGGAGGASGLSVGGAGGGIGGVQRSRQVGGGNREYNIDDVRVVADEENNALIIYATGREYRKIRDALVELDVVVTQVIIEASILEVTLEDGLEYGLEWAFSGGIGGGYSGNGLLSFGSEDPGPQVPGFSWEVTNSTGDFTAVLNALAKQSLINVISTPSIMVLDNHTAAIHVGDQVPVQSRQNTTDGGVITQSIEYRDTGVKLSVTPSVNAGGMVTMTVEQSVTDIGPVDAATKQRQFLERNISSRVAVRSDESVVLGGLIRENVTEGTQGIPLLSSIPVIGGLFGSQKNEGRRTELLVIITPRVIYSESDLRDVTTEMRSRMRDLKLIDESASRQLLSTGGSSE